MTTKGSLTSGEGESSLTKAELSYIRHSIFVYFQARII
jgi:hypothetical protein